jgi:hypothetical protein
LGRYPKFRGAGGGRMIRETSIEAYRTIKENGLLSRRRWQVYECLFEYGPLTRNEISKYLSKNLIKINSNLVSSRLVELREMGVIVEIKERICSITGMTVIEWDVTKKLPAKIKKPKRMRCKHCSGKGYIEDKQLELF